MIRLFIYPHAQPQLHESIPGFENTIPFSAAGRARHCEIVTDPALADYFYMGQVADKDAWQLHPNRWPYFTGNEAKHIVDCEGDYRDFDHPDWLAEAIITTGHVRLSSRAKFKRRFARPVISPLLMRLVNNPPAYTPPAERGFWFQGQMDMTHRIREKVHQAFVMAQVPGEWQWNSGWALYLSEDNPLVGDYLRKAMHWSHALCPIGEGPSVRLYEMAMLGRIPVLVGDYEPFGGEWHIRIGHHVDMASPEALATEMRDLIKLENSWMDGGNALLTECLARELRAYFADPTAYLLEWLRGRE